MVTRANDSPSYKPLINISFLTAPRASEAKRLTQVHLTHLGVGKDFFRRTGCNYRPLVHDVRAAANAQSLTDIVVGNQHSDVAGGELPDDSLDVQDGQRIHPREGLIEQHEAGLGGQRTRYLHAPPLAS